MLRRRRAARTGDGWWYPPTLVADITEDMDMYLEEVFGPVAQVYRAEDIDDAIRIANATRFGLGSNAWTTDPDGAGSVFVRDLQAGQTFINGMVASFPALPFGGIKASGHGRELAGARHPRVHQRQDGLVRQVAHPARVAPRTADPA